MSEKDIGELQRTDLAYTGRNLSYHGEFNGHKLTLVYSKVECVPTKVASIAWGFVWISQIPPEHSALHGCSFLKSYAKYWVRVK
jgi:hypothetical protein